ncbi:MAG: asparagine synthase (glutamine-hydrolyzing) [Ilyomonas sp.]
MCGIAGIISPYPSLIQQPRLQRMADVLIHRGPEDEGYWINTSQTVGFAHRRLCVVDLSQNASQPFHYLHYTLVYNGEIYNYIELKETLQKQGYTFSSKSDTEVIPAAYDYWGKDCLHHFDGMFAFALWDDKTQELFIARDRFGEKPLYYYAEYKQRGRFEQFLFASEMKALFAAGAPKNLNGTMMLNYLALGYVQNPQKKTETFYNNILSLPPGNYLTIQPSAGRVQMRKWYRPKLTSINISENDAIEKFRELFFASVKRRLRSDVATGTSLSGGVDSSSIVAAIHQFKTLSLQWKNIGFTAVFPAFEKDEAAYSKQVAEFAHIQQITIASSAEDWIKHWNELMYYQEEPLQSSSVLTQFLVYKLSKENNVTVLLDGQGADEILGGYKKYTHWFLQEMLRKNVSLFTKEKKLLKQNNFLGQWNWKNYLAAYLPEKTAQQLQKRAFNHLNEADIDTEFFHRYNNFDTLHKPVIKQLDEILYFNTFQFGLEELLRYADRNSMAHSREVRLPFLNHELVEFVFSLPSTYKIKDGFTKWILRKSMNNYLPSPVCWRKDKTGYEPPQKKWMENKTIHEMIYESKKILVEKNVLKKEVLQKRVQPKAAHEAGNYDWRYLCAASLF